MQIFICHVKEELDQACEVAFLLEGAGYRAWFFERDSLPGESYLVQTCKAVMASQAMIVLVSTKSVRSGQTRVEIVRAHETSIPFLPLLLDIKADDYPTLPLDWREALGASSALEIPQEGILGVGHRLLAGLTALGLKPSKDVLFPWTSLEQFKKFKGDAHSLSYSGVSPVKAMVPQNESSTRTTEPVSVSVLFDRQAYPSGDDPLSYFLMDVTLENPSCEGVKADIVLILDVSASMNRSNRYPLLVTAVREFVSNLAPDDTVGVVIFSRGAEIVQPMVSGLVLKSGIDDLVARMNSSSQKFGGATRLAEGLRLARAEIRGRCDSVRRVYVLTDGEIQDSPQCLSELQEFRQDRVEVNVYGFGSDFDAASLRSLVAGQIGGSVKPICNEKDIVATFQHVAEVNRRLVARDGVLTVGFDSAVACGDAWTFRPQERHLGAVEEHWFVRELGGLESGRTYSFMFEVRLPVGEGRTPVGAATLSWVDESDCKSETTFAFDVARTDATPSWIPSVSADDQVRVGKAFSILDALRRPDDSAAELAALSARRELATMEGRDPALLTALEKRISELKNGRASSLSKLDEQYISTDCETYAGSREEMRAAFDSAQATLCAKGAAHDEPDESSEVVAGYASVNANPVTATDKTVLHDSRGGIRSIFRRDK